MSITSAQDATRAIYDALVGAKGIEEIAPDTGFADLRVKIGGQWFGIHIEGRATAAQIRDLANRMVLQAANLAINLKWGTNAQMQAENDVYALTKVYDDPGFEQFSLKATTEERVKYALKYWEDKNNG